MIDFVKRFQQSSRQSWKERLVRVNKIMWSRDEFISALNMAYFFFFFYYLTLVYSKTTPVYSHAQQSRRKTRLERHRPEFHSDAVIPPAAFSLTKH
jgi:hypothetical protein